MGGRQKVPALGYWLGGVPEESANAVPIEGASKLAVQADSI